MPKKFKPLQDFWYKKYVVIHRFEDGSVNAIKGFDTQKEAIEFEKGAKRFLGKTTDILDNREGKTWKSKPLERKK